MKALEGSQLYHNFLRCSWGVNSIIDDGILTEFKLIPAFIVVLLSARMKKIHLKLKALELSQHFSHYKGIRIFLRRSMAANSTVAGLIWPNFEPI